MMIGHRRPLLERLMEKVEFDTNGGCWLWSGALSTCGYARLSIDGLNASASRAAWRLFRPKAPDGMLVCHRCDTPACVNPDHLFLGTHADNMRDMAIKGRRKRFPPEAVQEIRSSAETSEALARRFGMSLTHVSNIRRGRRRPQSTEGLRP